MKGISCSLLERKCPALPSAQNWQKPARTSYSHLLSGDVRPDVVYMEGMEPKGQASDIETNSYVDTLLTFPNMAVEQVNSFLCWKAGELYNNGCFSDSV